MIYPEVKLELWLKKYDLEVLKYSCPKCEKEFFTDVPVMTVDSAGLQSPIHSCGPEFWTAVLTPRTQEAKKFWNEIV